MSIVAASPPVEVKPPLIDMSSVLVDDPWLRGEAAAVLIQNLEPLLMSLRRVRHQAVVELAQAKVPQPMIASRVRLTQQRIAQIVKAFPCRAGVAS